MCCHFNALHISPCCPCVVLFYSARCSGRRHLNSDLVTTACLTGSGYITMMIIVGHVLMTGCILYYAYTETTHPSSFHSMYDATRSYICAYMRYARRTLVQCMQLCRCRVGFIWRSPARLITCWALPDGAVRTPSPSSAKNGQNGADFPLTGIAKVAFWHHRDDGKTYQQVPMH